jgi:hypothetical protein
MLREPSCPQSRVTVSRRFDVKPVTYGIDACGVTIRYVCDANSANPDAMLPCAPERVPHDVFPNARLIATYSLRPGDVVEEDAAGLVGVRHSAQQDR